MSHKPGKLSPANPKTNTGAGNRNLMPRFLDYQEAMEVEQPDFNTNMQPADTPEPDRSPNLSNLSQDERPQVLFSMSNPPASDTSFEQLDDPIDTYDDNYEGRASGLLEAVFDNVTRQKSAASKGDIRLLSEAKMIRCLPWKILVIFHPPDACASIGVFVQCNAESESQTWSCTAKATIQLVARSGCKNREMTIHHTFTHKENDWGFQQFIPYNELFNPDNGFISTTDSILIRAMVKADAPHGADWDSKRHTGFVGLKNQGATCYLNSLLQALYCTNKLRRAVFLMPTESDDALTSVPLALQRVFYELQFSDHAVGTKKLTRSFGWATLDSFMQHDAQELCRVLLDNLENKMKGTSVEDVIPGLFCGKMLSYISCLNVPYESKREENFYDIQLKVNGNRTIYDAFNEYIAKETLSQDNKYDAGEYGLQEAEKGVIFTRFPPVLYLQLMRFQYDFVADTNIKLNDRFEFPYKLKLDQFLAEPKPSTYLLHAVLVHSGDNHGGHYVVYINPALDGVWFQFDDDVVSRCSSRDAIIMNFGGNAEMRLYTNAYMLVYIAESAKDDVLCPIYETDIPESLRERFIEEHRVEMAKRLQKEKVHLFTGIHLVLEEDFFGWQGPDFCSHEHLPNRLLRVQKQTLRPKLIEDIAAVLHYKPENIRLWRLQPRRKNIPPHLIELNDNMPLCSLKETLFFVQHYPSPSNNTVSDLLNARLTIPGPERDQLPVDRHLFFLKYFDPVSWTLTFCGHVELGRDECLSALEPVLRSRAGLSPNCKLILHQDDSKALVSEITQLDVPISKLYKKEIQGHIIYFQVKTSNSTVPTHLGLMDTTEVGREALSSLLDEGNNSTSNLPATSPRSSDIVGGENLNGLLGSTVTPIEDVVGGNGNANPDTMDLPVSTIDPFVLHKMATFSTGSNTKTSLISPAVLPLQTSLDDLSIYDYFTSHMRQFEILLVDKLRPTDAGLLLRVSADLTYWEFANLAAAHLSTQANLLQFFRSQQGFGTTIDLLHAPIYVSPVAPTAGGLPSSDLASPPAGCDVNSTNTGPNSAGSVDNVTIRTKTSPLSLQYLAAKASGFSPCSTFMNSLVAAAAAQGLSREPPGAAISSTHCGPMQDFFASFTGTPVNSSWSSDVAGVGTGLSAGGGTLGSGAANTPTPDRFPVPLNRYCGAGIVIRTPFGPFTLPPPRRVYYAHLAIRIDELETMRQVRVIYVGHKLSEKAELLLSVPQNGLVMDLLKEASRHLILPPGGSGQLRLLRVSRNRIMQEYSPNVKLSQIPESTVFPQGYAGASPIHSLRIEEVPLDELSLQPNETVVYVSHFDKAFTETFGVPFTVRIRDKENYSAVRERIRRRLEVPEKEFDRWRFAVIFPTEGTYIPNEQNTFVKIEHFNQHCQPEHRPWLGIDHKPSKRPRYAPNEKPIKIHN